MTDEEAGKRFEDLINIYEGNDVIGTVRRWTAGGSGLLTLVGPYGTGKTTLLCCAVNYVNNQGGTAVYTTAKRLLDYLRSTYGDEAEMSFDRAWDTLTTVPMLAIDELDKVATRSSDWAREQLDTLVDTRWRHQHEWLTLTAMNETVEALPGAMASRLADGRGKVIQVRARDMRPWMGGE